MCDDWARDCGSVVFRSDGRSDRSRDKYFSKVELEDVSAGSSCLSLPSVSRSSRSGSAIMALLSMSPGWGLGQCGLASVSSRASVSSTMQ